MKKKLALFLFYSLFLFIGYAPDLLSSVTPGVDSFFDDGIYKRYEDKRIGLITNHTGLSQNGTPSYELFQKKMKLVALFAPEHGIKGDLYAEKKVEDSKKEEIPIHSLHGNTRRPTDKMLEGIDLLVFDIQDIGSRTYTYASTLFYAMEEAAKRKIPVVVLDRPNPINGLTVDGPILVEKYRSFIGYLHIPYCHGMTIGELSHYFNHEYKIGCDLRVVKMKGWKREMTFSDTGLVWIPPSPNIPEQDTPWYYPSTGILGMLKIVNIGVGFTLPFKIVGAPWIDAESFAHQLNKQKLKGVYFSPFCFKPFYGIYKNKNCQGVKIHVTDREKYRPVAVQYLILGILKSLYPKEVEKRLAASKPSDIHAFSLANGTETIYQLLKNEKYIAWKMIDLDADKRKEFLMKRQKYLLY